MSNLLIPQNSNINNEIAASKLFSKSSTGRYIEAPQSLPKYSIDKALQEKDDFRRTIIQEQNKGLYKKKNNPFLKIGLILAAVGGFLLFKKKLN